MCHRIAGLLPPGDQNLALLQKSGNLGSRFPPFLSGKIPKNTQISEKFSPAELPCPRGGRCQPEAGGRHCVGSPPDYHHDDGGYDDGGYEDGDHDGDHDDGDYDDGDYDDGDDRGENQEGTFSAAPPGKMFLTTAPLFKKSHQQ